MLACHIHQKKKFLISRLLLGVCGQLKMAYIVNTVMPLTQPGYVNQS